RLVNRKVVSRNRLFDRDTDAISQDRLRKNYAEDEGLRRVDLLVEDAQSRLGGDRLPPGCTVGNTQGVGQRDVKDTWRVFDFEGDDSCRILQFEFNRLPLRLNSAWRPVAFEVAIHGSPGPLALEPSCGFDLI